LSQVLSLVLAILIGVFGSGAAQESTEGSVDVSVTIYPSGEGVEIDGEETYVTGIVWATIVVVSESRLDLGTEDAPSSTTLVVGDDRGTSSGWSVYLQVESPDDDGLQASLVQNETVTIRRILPVMQLSPDGDAKVVAGGSLGTLSEPAPVLLAVPGSGSGVFEQTMVIYHTPQDEGVVQTIVVDISFSP
jgi:hypothetical protein